MRTILKIGVVLGMFLLMPGLYSYTQVSINTDGSQPDSSAMLDVKSNNKGFLPPRVALSNINSSDPITSPAIGLLIYNTANSGTPPNNVMKGYYYWNGTQWISLVPIPGDTTWTDIGFSAKKQISKRDTIQSKILKLTTIPTKIDTSHKFLSPSSNGLIEQSDASKLFGIDYNNLTNKPTIPDTVTAYPKDSSLNIVNFIGNSLTYAITGAYTYPKRCIKNLGGTKWITPGYYGTNGITTATLM